MQVEGMHETQNFGGPSILFHTVGMAMIIITPAPLRFAQNLTGILSAILLG